MSNLGQIKLTEAEVFIIKNAMKENLESKSKGLGSCDVSIAIGPLIESPRFFEADFLESCSQESIVLMRLSNWLEYQQQRRDEEDERQEEIKNGEVA